MSTLSKLFAPLLVSALMLGCVHMGHEIKNSEKTLVAPELSAEVGDNELFALDHNLRDRFLAYFNDPINAATPEHERVANFLSIIIDRFTYVEQTFPAQQALETMSGNCLSLALITAAYARIAEVPIRFQLLGANPVFALQEDLLIKTDHIRSVLSGQWQRDEDEAFDIRRDIRIDYFPTQGLQYQDNLALASLIAMYHNNKAVEALQELAYESAFASVSKSLEFEPDNAAALNTLAILYRRTGNDTKAESTYVYARNLYPENLSFTRNFLQLLLKQERGEEANRLQAQLDQAQEKNPWRWVMAGQSFERAGRYSDAITHYNRALEIQDDLHLIHLYLGIAHYKNGDKRKSKRHLAKAVKYSDRDVARRNYKRKLRALD